MGWFARKKFLYLCPKLIVCSGKEKGSFLIKGDHCKERVIVLGEEHEEVMPNGEVAKVIEIYN